MDSDRVDTENPIGLHGTLREPVGPPAEWDAAEWSRHKATFAELVLEVESLRSLVSEAGGSGGEGVRAILASIGSAPTNWHQATVYCLTTKAEEDKEMRRTAPRMFACGVFMVFMQFLAAGSVAAGMLFPTCLDSTQCPRGQFCFLKPERNFGRCRFCGHDSPLVTYAHTTDRETGYGPTNREVQMNRIDDGSYTSTGWLQESLPTKFGGFNDTHLKSTCARPFKAVGKITVEESDERQPNGWRDIVSYSGEDIPDGIVPIRGESEYPARSVGQWCDNCISPLTNDVSTLNELELAQNNMMSMSYLDFAALAVCSYVVGLSVVGEIKDTRLCAIAADRNRNELSRSWQLALALFNRFRVHVLVQCILIAVPMVILTQGGSALTIAFNTVAILFLTDIDNLSYQFGLDETAKRRVDEAGHVQMTAYESRQLSRTKAFCTTIVVVGICIAVRNGRIFQSAVMGTTMTFLCQASEVLSMPESTLQEKAIVVGLAGVSQCVGFMSFTAVIVSAESGNG